MALIHSTGKRLTGKEVHFLSRDEDDYPQLTRLCLDFDFRVLSIGSSESDQLSQYLISDKHYREQDISPITPSFNSLAELENYTNTHIIDILSDTLMEDIDLGETEQPSF